MKLHLSILTGVASVAAIMSNVFADTAVTDPVGYVTVPVTQASGPAPGISFIGATLVNKIEVQGAVPSDGSGTTIPLPTNSGVTSGQFGVNSIGQPLYYVEIASGPNAGTWTDIASTNGVTLTTSDAIGGMATTGTIIKIRKHHTFDSFFGDSVTNVKIVPGLDLSEADQVDLYNPTGTPQLTSYFFSTDDLGVIGWTNVNTGAPAGDEVIAPGAGAKLTRRSPITAPSFVQVGHVKTGPTVLPIEPGINYVTIPWSVGVNMTVSGIYDSLVDPLTIPYPNPVGLNPGFDLGTADEVQVFNSGVPTSYFLSNDDLSPGLLPGDTLLKEGTSIRLFRQTATAFNWVAPAVNIAP